MGLYMKRLAVKTTLCLLIPVVLFLIVGCMKNPEINKEFGPKVSGVEINQALTLAKYASTVNSIDNIKQGEFAYYEKSTQIENIYPMIILQKADTVSKRDPQPTKIVYTITRELREIDPSSGTSKNSKTQENACQEVTAGGCDAATQAIGASSATSGLNTPPTSLSIQAANAMLANPPPEFIKFNERMKDLSLRGLVNQMSTSPVEQFTYHNLQKKESTLVTPALVAKRDNCGGRGADKCNTPMKTYEVSFDEVDWLSEKYPVKYTYKLVFSPEAPFFSSLMSSCGSTTIPFQGQRISLLQCDISRDFTVGQ